MTATAKLNRTTFSTSRLLDFCSRKELIAQTGHQPGAWPLVVVKELLDNALDACEDAGIEPEIKVTVARDRITVADNGPGIPAETVQGVLDFSVRVSNREAYVSPDRGAQGNALKTLVALPFVLDGDEGRVEIAAQGIRHEIRIKVDRIRQRPVIDHQTHPAENVKTGTVVALDWPDSASLLLEEAQAQFLQIADDYTLLNPHLSLCVDWFGRRTEVPASAPDWSKWCPSNPTCPHWYGHEHLERLIAAYLAHQQRDRTVREFVSEFRGLTGSAKQKRVLDATGMARTNLSELANGDGLDRHRVGQLLDAMKEHTQAVPPKNLGVIGRDHLAGRFKELGCEMESFQYKKVQAVSAEGLPFVLETAFGAHEAAFDADSETDARRRIVTGVNWSPGIINLFRELGTFGRSLDAILEEQRVGSDEPVVFLLHVACPRVEYADRGKSSVVIED